ncbi:hypothetical protein F0562_029864 [Nyssa sinensis]|uniref:Uncharacterized protein n=1 Tax=Nyssa sinensis TaxID=561372 RepID=A0A5J5AX84_9ASTE|nr:hypothetical protein F0562_029864 [Nyssa sinensis]
MDSDRPVPTTMRSKLWTNIVNDEQQGSPPRKGVFNASVNPLCKCASPGPEILVPTSLKCEDSREDVSDSHSIEVDLEASISRS